MTAIDLSAVTLVTALAAHLPRTIHLPPERPICERCHFRPAIKTDGDSRLVCDYCASGRPEPHKHAVDRVGRNNPCPCGSGRKYKGCCRIVGA